jgi:hypothetical protein
MCKEPTATSVDKDDLLRLAQPLCEVLNKEPTDNPA